MPFGDPILSLLLTCTCFFHTRLFFKFLALYVLHVPAIKNTQTDRMSLTANRNQMNVQDLVYSICSYAT